MTLKNMMIAATMGALALGGTATAAFAGSEIQPGITAGIPLGAPLPQGLFVIDMPNYGYRDADPGQSVGALVPAWRSGRRPGRSWAVASCSTSRRRW